VGAAGGGSVTGAGLERLWLAQATTWSNASAFAACASAKASFTLLASCRAAWILAFVSFASRSKASIFACMAVMTMHGRSTASDGDSSFPGRPRAGSTATLAPDAFTPAVMLAPWLEGGVQLASRFTTFAVDGDSCIKAGLSPGGNVERVGAFVPGIANAGGKVWRVTGCGLGLPPGRRAPLSCGVVATAGGRIWNGQGFWLTP